MQGITGTFSIPIPPRQLLLCDDHPLSAAHYNRKNKRAKGSAVRGGTNEFHQTPRLSLSSPHHQPKPFLSPPTSKHRLRLSDFLSNTWAPTLTYTCTPYLGRKHDDPHAHTMANFKPDTKNQLCATCTARKKMCRCSTNPITPIRRTKVGKT